MANTLEQWYASIPTVTRMYLTLTFAVTVGCALEVRAFESMRRDSFLLSFRCWGFAAPQIHFKTFSEPTFPNLRQNLSASRA